MRQQLASWLRNLKRKLKELYNFFKRSQQFGFFLLCDNLGERREMAIVIKHIVRFSSLFILKGENMDKEKLIEDIIEILEEDEKYIERPIVINIYLGSDE